MSFLIPYFWIVGFDNGDIAAKFFWYWLFLGLYSAALVFLGNFLACFFPNSAASNGKRAIANVCRIVCLFVLLAIF